jgi:hypothetical protein
MTGTTDIYQFSLRLPGPATPFEERIPANNKALAEQIVRTKYPGVIILSCIQKERVREGR